MLALGSGHVDTLYWMLSIRTVVLRCALPAYHIHQTIRGQKPGIASVCDAWEPHTSKNYACRVYLYVRVKGVISSELQPGQQPVIQRGRGDHL